MYTCKSQKECFAQKALSSKENLVTSSIALRACPSRCIYHSWCHPLASSIPRLYLVFRLGYLIRWPRGCGRFALIMICRNKARKTMLRTRTDSQLCSVQGPFLLLRSSLITLLMSFLILMAVRKLRFGMVENPNSALDLLQSVQKCSFVYFSREFDPDSRNLLLLFRLFFWTFSPAWW